MGGGRIAYKTKFAMKIGLIDVDGSVHKASNKAGMRYPNIALGKLARYHRQRGDDVEWAIPFFHYDRIYMSKIFNFSTEENVAWSADEIVRGGTGYDIASRLPEEVDRLQPDYSVFPYLPRNMAYGFLTRGCPNHCPWCVVPIKEGRIKPYMDVDEIAIEGRTTLVLMDNNILAGGQYAIGQMEKIIARGYAVDFNQALDARLVDDTFARLLAKIKWFGNIRFGCDTHKQIEHCERAIETINEYGYKGNYTLYTMLDDDICECYDRIKYWWVRLQKARKNHERNQIFPYAQPFRDPLDPFRPIPQWQRDMAGWINKRNIFTLIPFEDFEPRKGFRCDEYLR